MYKKIVIVILFSLLLTGCKTDLNDPTITIIDDNQIEEALEEREIEFIPMTEAEMTEVMSIIDSYRVDETLFQNRYTSSLFTSTDIISQYFLPFDGTFVAYMVNAEAFKVHQYNPFNHQYFEIDSVKLMIYKVDDETFMYRVENTIITEYEINTTNNRMYFDGNDLINPTNAQNFFVSRARNYTEYKAYQIEEMYCVYHINHELTYVEDSTTEFYLNTVSQMACYNDETNEMIEFIFYPSSNEDTTLLTVVVYTNVLSASVVSRSHTISVPAGTKTMYDFQVLFDEMDNVEYNLDYDYIDSQVENLLIMPFTITTYEPDTVYTRDDLNVNDLIALFPDEILITNCEITNTNNQQADIKSFYYNEELILEEVYTTSSSTNIDQRNIDLIEITEYYSDRVFSIVYNTTSVTYQTIDLLTENTETRSIELN